MAKSSPSYSCSSCGAKSLKWQGKCFECGSYNSFVEEIIVSFSKASSHRSLEAKSLVQAREKPLTRIPFSLLGLDEILGGGVIAGQVILLGGEPGVGKSTLLTQVAGQFPTLYVCGEESSGQVALRIERLGLTTNNINFIDDRDVDAVATFLDSREVSAQSKLVIVDSIQSLFSTSIPSVPGSIAQVQYSATKLCEIAKKHCYVMVFVGQVTKSGYFAGPKLLEHIVDTVLSFEGDRKQELRVLRVLKNRFGPSDKVEVYQMTSAGLVSADDYLAALIKSDSNYSTGSVKTVIMEGSRPLIVEVQALNAPAQYGNARLVVTGLSTKRVQMLLAVLHRRCGINTTQYDMYVNVSGGFKVDDPATDVPICLAIASVVKDKSIPSDNVFYGEVGLLGEVKGVSFSEKRDAEITKRGFTVGKTAKLLREIVQSVLE